MKAQKYLFSLVIVTVMYFTIAVLTSPARSREQVHNVTLVTARAHFSA